MGGTDWPPYILEKERNRGRGPLSESWQPKIFACIDETRMVIFKAN